MTVQGQTVVDANSACQIAKTHEQEVTNGKRFAFGGNWANFLKLLDETRISEAVESLKAMLEVDSLKGQSFLDVGSGSGLFSLAAKRLGARVVSFDYDPQSVACTRELKRRFYRDDTDWQIESGSVLERSYLKSLGKFDVVYSWGVLHHTGDMWLALSNVDSCVANNGKLFIALYNDQGGASHRWLIVKRVYNKVPAILRPIYLVAILLPRESKSFLIHLVRGKPQNYFSQIVNYKTSRGMSWLHDQIDWIGGYPFEVARPDQVFSFFRKRGYKLEVIKTCGGSLGCNEFVFQRNQ